MKKKIHVNLLGYMVGMPKMAVCAVSAGIFYIADARTGTNIYAGRLSKPVYDHESGDTVRIAEFSDFNRTGQFFIRAGYRRSDVFEISERPYTRLKGLALEGIYLNRCGFDYSSDTTDIRAESPYIHDACHTGKLAVYSDPTGQKYDVSGGWHEYGGSYARYSTAASGSIAHMLYALKLFPDSFSRAEREMTEKECRWGFEWLLKMQSSDGGVYHKTSSIAGSEMTAPEDDGEEYFVFEKTAQATSLFIAIAALGADYFSESDSRLANRLQRAAEKAWLWLVQTEDFENYMNPAPIKPEFFGGIPGQATDDYFMWAVCEMYNLTGDEFFCEAIEKKYLQTDFSGFGRNSVGGFAALAYLMTPRKKDRAVESMIRKKITDAADRMWIADRASGYRTARSAGSGFVYASNFHILSDAMCLAVAYLLSGDNRYLIGVSDQIGYIFGCNPFGISYMTCSCSCCCSRPYHRISVCDDIDEPVMGMIVSGANVSRNDGYSIWHIEKGTPPSRCYVDNEYSYSTNETAIHFSTPVIFLSAFYEKPGRSTLTRRSLNRDPDIVE
ncbi:MAG: glycoside hydrolase family 9 protein [Huintestinicola sp.]